MATIPSKNFGLGNFERVTALGNGELSSPEPEDAIDIDVLVEEGDELPDGSQEFSFGERSPELSADVPFDGNLAEHLDDKVLGEIASDLISDFEADKLSRQEWENAYTKGLDLLGLKVEYRTVPWDKACGVYHPVLAEAAVRFQSNAIMEIFPAVGPAETAIQGEVTPDRIKQAKRVKNDMNWMATKRMREYRSETEQLLFRLALSGSCFRKVYFDPHFQRPVAITVPAEDFFVSYGASNLSHCERFTHTLRKTKNELRRLQVSGFYKDVDLAEPQEVFTPPQEKEAKVQSEAASIQKDDRYLLLEIHVDYDLPGFEDKYPDSDEPTGIGLPYVITIERYSNTVLAIRRNWREEDETKRRRSHFVSYQYLPGFGFYGIGLIHLIGGLTKAITSMLRMLVDAGTLANIPAGLKARGLRIKSDDKPLRPGELRDVDIVGGAIRDNIEWLPFKEPSAVLHELMRGLVEEARRLGSIADMDISAGAQQAPVGTTLALLERSLKVMSAVQARLHASLSEELQLLAEIIKEFMPPEYEYDVGGSYTRQEDYDDRVDIIPVSDPNATTMGQRLLQYQVALDMASRAPNIYDLPKLHRSSLQVIGIDNADQIIPSNEDMLPMDPVSENMAILTGKPVKAFLDQDHEAHIAVHMAASQDPKLLELVGQSPQAASIQQAMVAHITEHVSFQYRKDIEQQLGAQLPPLGEPLPPDIEAKLARLTADAAYKLLDKDKAEHAAKKAQEEMKDPLTQIQLRELKIKEDKVKADYQLGMEQIKVDRERIKSTERTKGAELGVDIAADLAEGRRQEIIEGTRMGVDIASKIKEAQRQDIETKLLATDAVTKRMAAKAKRAAEQKPKATADE